MSERGGAHGRYNQFWESAPVSEPNRIYFTAESHGRVIAGASGIGATLTNEQVADLTRWLILVGGLSIQAPRKRHTLTAEDWAA